MKCISLLFLATLALMGQDFRRVFLVGFPDADGIKKGPNRLSFSRIRRFQNTMAWYFHHAPAA
jgi:hypothetical protein